MCPIKNHYVIQTDVWSFFFVTNKCLRCVYNLSDHHHHHHQWGMVECCATIPYHSLLAVGLLKWLGSLHSFSDIPNPGTHLKFAFHPTQFLAGPPSNGGPTCCGIIRPAKVGPKWKSAGANQSCFFLGFPKTPMFASCRFQTKKRNKFLEVDTTEKIKHHTVHTQLPRWCQGQFRKKKRAAKRSSDEAMQSLLVALDVFGPSSVWKKTMKNWRSQPANHGRLTQFLLDPNTVGWWLHIFQQIA